MVGARCVAMQAHGYLWDKQTGSVCVYLFDKQTGSNKPVGAPSARERQGRKGHTFTHTHTGEEGAQGQ